MNAKRAVVAGMVATIAVTTFWLVEPYLGLPELAVGSMLSSALAVATAYLPIPPVAGWTIHVVVGIGLAIAYAMWFVDRLKGAPAIRGVAFGFGVFLLAQLIFMPLVGAGVFSRGDGRLLIGSLIGHVIYGGLVGAIYGIRPASAAARPA